MLTNNLAEVITDRPSAVVSVGRLWRKFLRLRRGCRPLREGTDLFDGADTDAVSFPQSSVDSASFGDAHFGTVDEERDIGGIGIAVTDKTFALRRLVHGGLEHPSRCRRFGKLRHRLNMDSDASTSTS